MPTVEVKVPDIGGFHDVPVIEVMVKAGDAVNTEDPLLTLESDKATIELPSPATGVVKELKLKVGDKVSEGSLVLLMDAEAAPAAAPAPEPVPEPAPAPAPSEPAVAAASPAAPPGPAAPEAPAAAPEAPVAAPAAPIAISGSGVHASPSLRQFARELGVDLAQVTGSGPKGRILREDVEAHVKRSLAVGSGAAAPVAADLPPWPQVDFAKFGPIETRPLSRIRKIAGGNLRRNWVTIPHVTQFDEADVTELEAFRAAVNHEQDGVKLTMLAFLIKAVVAAMKIHPEFNASLDGDNLVLKQYFHVGFAADTPHGLVVPVVKDADRKGVMEIAAETTALAAKAREGKLGPADMEGGCFSISSLGGIGGTAFTPIVNAPEVAILGVSRNETKPKWNGSEFVPRLMLPLSLSYDHRVIDGALAARFTTLLGRLLADMRRTLL